MNTTFVAMAAGATAGAGLATMLKALLPGTPDLAAAMARMAGTDRPAPVDVATDTTLKAKVGAKITARVAVPTLPTSPSSADLDLVGTTPHEHLGEKVLAAATGIVLPPVAAVVLGVIGMRVPVWLLAAIGAAFLVGGWLAPDLAVAADARKARDELDRAVAAVLELVAVQRLGGAGVAQALRQAVAGADSPPFVRLAEAVAVAELNGHQPWDGLDDLAARLEDPRHPGSTQSLKDTAANCRQAAQQGSQVADQLAGRARAMRGAQTSNDRARANAASVTMTAPMSMTVIVVAVAIMVPLGWQVLAT